MNRLPIRALDCRVEHWCPRRASALFIRLFSCLYKSPDAMGLALLRTNFDTHQKSWFWLPFFHTGSLPVAWPGVRRSPFHLQDWIAGSIRVWAYAIYVLIGWSIQFDLHGRTILTFFSPISC
ncbi:hypothetical protein K458DRAFT_30938 [Lentithecium fluviatile CBS 122367]|uniref:Uncharacterized protein n=1 Tax=Lentithecium fluviatile CBS 122367 TaxID=1168545 RepID=A0A6G1J1H1_9PLEO|nr:hypothetical protein K458DRAFT_30938 [Lentithecium fluviatile CBS 122367]